MDIIECGGARLALQIGNDGLAVAHFSGLLLPGNIQALSAITLDVAAACGVKGLLYCGGQAALCCDAQSIASTYPTMSPRQRRVPVAFVAHPAQAALHDSVVRRAAAQGVLRKTFYNPADARAWMAQTVRLLQDNRDWWLTRG